MACVFFRRPRTHQEMVANCGAMADGLPTRAARSRKRLPTLWDDLNRNYSRCWKRHRKTQYK
jgi:hypothetical protein